MRESRSSAASVPMFLSWLWPQCLASGPAYAPSLSRVYSPPKPCCSSGARVVKKRVGLDVSAPKVLHLLINVLQDEPRDSTQGDQEGAEAQRSQVVLGDAPECPEGFLTEEVAWRPNSCILIGRLVEPETMTYSRSSVITASKTRHNKYVLPPRVTKPK